MGGITCSSRSSGGGVPVYSVVDGMPSSRGARRRLHVYGGNTFHAVAAINVSIVQHACGYPLHYSPHFSKTCPFLLSMPVVLAYVLDDHCVRAAEQATWTGLSPVRPRDRRLEVTQGKPHSSVRRILDWFIYEVSQFVWSYVFW